MMRAWLQYYQLYSPTTAVHIETYKRIGTCQLNYDELYAIIWDSSNVKTGTGHIVIPNIFFQTVCIVCTLQFT